MIHKKKRSPPGGATTAKITVSVSGFSHHHAWTYMLFTDRYCCCSRDSGLFFEENSNKLLACLRSR